VLARRAFVRRGLRVEHVAGAQREQIGAAIHREEARHDLLGVHLEGEDERGMAALRHVEGHRESEARLADRGARRDDDEVAGGEALGIEVDLAEAGRDAADLVRSLHPLTQVVEVLLQGGLDVPELGVR